MGLKKVFLLFPSTKYPAMEYIYIYIFYPGLATPLYAATTLDLFAEAEMPTVGGETNPSVSP